MQFKTVKVQYLGWFIIPGSSMRRLVPLCADEDGVLMPDSDSVPELFTQDEEGMPAGHLISNAAMIISPN